MTLTAAVASQPFVLIEDKNVAPLVGGWRPGNLSGRTHFPSIGFQTRNLPMTSGSPARVPVDDRESSDLETEARGVQLINAWNC